MVAKDDRLRVGSLFAGIGGFDLGFERAGMQTAWWVEQDPYCQAVLRKNFPSAQGFDDVCAVGADDLPPVDVLCGGFPCQDLSVAGRGTGIDGARSGLWSEFARLIRELRPRYVIVENVPALLTGKGKRWDRAPIGRVLGDLSEMGYDAEWSVLSAREFGAPHLRKRVWIVAYPASERGWSLTQSGCPTRGESREPSDGGGTSRTGAMADAVGARLQRTRTPKPEAGVGRRPGDSYKEASGQWLTEPDVGRVANGVPSRVDRLKALGNALVPQIAEWIGQRIVAYEAQRVEGQMTVDDCIAVAETGADL